MPLYRLPDPGTVTVVNATSSASSSASSAPDSSSEFEESRRQLEHIRVILEERLPHQDESQATIASEQGR